MINIKPSRGILNTSKFAGERKIVSIFMALMQMLRENRKLHEGKTNTHGLLSQKKNLQTVEIKQKQVDIAIHGANRNINKMNFLKHKM